MTSWGRPSRLSGGSSRKCCGTISLFDSKSPRSFRACNQCWMGCLLTGPGGTSSAAAGQGSNDADRHFSAGGGGRCVYAEAIDLSALGQLTIQRGSHVEPTSDGQWLADLEPVSGPVLGPFARRSDALTAEVAWLESHWLPAAQPRVSSFPICRVQADPGSCWGRPVFLFVDPSLFFTELFP